MCLTYPEGNAPLLSGTLNILVVWTQSRQMAWNDNLTLAIAILANFFAPFFQDKEDVVTASCVLRTFTEDPYDSPDSDEE